MTRSEALRLTSRVLRRTLLVLVAIPLFTFAGYVLSESDAPGRLVRFTRAFLGWMPGGLAIVALAACALC